MLLRLRIVYRGQATGTPGIDLGLEALIVPENRGLVECGAYPDSLMDLPELLPGGEAEITVCGSVPSNRINGLAGSQSTDETTPQADTEAVL